MSQHRFRVAAAGRLAAIGAFAFLLFVCAGEEDYADVDEPAGAPETVSEPAAAAPASGLLTSAQAVDRQIALWEDLIAELETIHDEATAQAAVPQLSAIAAEGAEVSRSIDPNAPVGPTDPGQSDRLETVRDRYVQELTRITQEAPAAVPIIGDALASVERAP